jgi:hypothetical protein
VLGLAEVDAAALLDNDSRVAEDFDAGRFAEGRFRA